MKISEINFLSFYKERDLLGSNSWESFNNYKLLNAEQLKFDCDNSSQAKKLLKAIFGDNRYTDTLISPQSYVTLYMRYHHSDLLEYNARYKKYIVPDIAGLKKRMVNEGVAENAKTISNQAVWAYFGKINKVQIHESMLKFLHAVYTLPNFSVVCRGFNVGRVTKTQDNFLVALNHIYDWFKEREMKNQFFKPHEELDKFVSRTAYLTQVEVVSEIQEWLNEYGSFADFIEKYYLQDFLEDPDSSNSKPKELWEGIFNGNLQPSEKEFLPSIDFLTNAIKCRGNRMVEANPGL